MLFVNRCFIPDTNSYQRERQWND